MLKCALCGFTHSYGEDFYPFIGIDPENGEYVCKSCFGEAAHEYQLWLLAKLQKEIAERKAKKARVIAETIVKGMNIYDTL